MTSASDAGSTTSALAEAGRHVDRLHVRASLMIIGIVATLPVLLKPIIVGALEDHSGLDRAQVAFIPAAEQLGAGLVSLLIAPLLAKHDRRLMILIGLVVLATTNAFSLMVGGLVAFVAVRFLAGLGGGAALSVVKGNFAGSAIPDRLFALYSVLMVLSGAVASPILAQLAGRFGVNGVFGALLLLCIPALILTIWTPSRAGGARPEPSPEAGAAPVEVPAFNPWTWQVWRCLLGIAAFFGGVGMLWPYAERIGVELGLSAQQAGGIIGISLLAGGFGAFLAVVLGARWGRALPITLGLIGATLAMGVILISGGSAAMFTLAISLFTSTWFFTFPYILGTMSAQDPQGRIVVLAFVAQTLFTAAGPVLATGYLALFDTTLPNLAWPSAVGFLLTFFLFVPLARRLDRQNEAAPSA